MPREHTVSELLMMQPTVRPSDEQLWRHLIHEREMWYDKRPTINNAPAFVHKKDHIGLWLNDWTPAWAKDSVKRLDAELAAPWAKVRLYVVFLCKPSCFSSGPRRYLSLLMCCLHV